jgi:small subunit ribosomal protein S21
MSDTNKKSYKNSKWTKGGETVKTDSIESQYANIEPVELKPLEVKVYNGNFDKALKAFRALVQKERVLSTYKEKQTYEKPSVRKRRKRNEAKRKLLEFDNEFSRKPRRPRKIKIEETRKE